MKSTELQALLENTILVCDGAMGSQLYERVGPTRCFEELNLLQPELVLRVHLNYIEAGARLIETNTFGANRLKLVSLGLADQFVAINQRAVKLAREAREVSGAAILIAGSIGPLGAGWRVAEPEAGGRARELFAEQAAALEERGIDLFILETFPDLEELVWAVEAVRSLSGLPIIAQLAYNEEGKTLGGDDARTGTERLQALGVDVIGANCSIGPQAMLEVLCAMGQSSGVRLSVQPNVGFPQRLGDRVLYPKATPDYFSSFAREAVRSGASIIGGCCGTTPEHIRAMAQAVRDLTPSRDSRPRASVVLEAPPPAVVQAEPVSALYRKLQAGQFVISVEIDPPKGVNLERILEAVEQFRRSGGVDAVDINSGTLARVGMDALLLAAAIERAGMETIPHLTTRDANIIGLQAMLLGAWAVGGIRNILAITGDPPVLGDHPEVAGVYEVDAVGLVRIIRRLNEGTDWAGKALGGSTNFAIGVALNPAADNLDEEIQRFHLKVEAGAHFAMTQPIFDPELWYAFVKRLGDKPPIPIVIGLWPLTSYKLAVRLDNEVPGIVIPAHVQKGLEQAGAAARDRGFALARELFAWARTEAAGVYIIPPFKKFEEALEVITD
ncbi:MAG: bifunctional homocysteine S-methyltransferase/methylenetetrahydrofolate reductase [Terriglobia bacterium]